VIIATGSDLERERRAKERTRCIPCGFYHDDEGEYVGPQEGAKIEEKALTPSAATGRTVWLLKAPSSDQGRRA
jgi:hypothetical protein